MLHEGPYIHSLLWYSLKSMYVLVERIAPVTVLLMQFSRGERSGAEIERMVFLSCGLAISLLALTVAVGVVVTAAAVVFVAIIVRSNPSKQTRQTDSHAARSI